MEKRHEPLSHCFCRRNLAAALLVSSSFALAAPGATKDEANQVKSKLEAAGAVVELK